DGIRYGHVTGVQTCALPIYAIFYGLTMLAVLCWTVTVDPFSRVVKRNFALAGMIFALAAGISTNYFAVLAFFPIAGGELVRTLRSEEGRVGKVVKSKW